MTHFLDADNVMIDLETLGQRPDSAIMSIGACTFRFNSGGKTVDKFYINVDPKDCKKHGMVIEKSTVEWWMKQSPEVIKSFKNPAPVPLQDALTQFSKWFGSSTRGKPFVWSNGAAFDLPILEIAYRNLGMEPPWYYRNTMCYRTVCNLSNISNNKLRESDAMLHNALCDAEAQAKILMDNIDDVPF